MGNAAFVDRLSSSGKVNVLRIVNAGDMVTMLGVAPRLPHKKEQYQHVGAELRIDSKNSPCLRPDARPACWHDLEAYLRTSSTGSRGQGGPSDTTPAAASSGCQISLHNACFAID